jgi:predicted dehydrogenase
MLILLSESIMPKKRAIICGIGSHAHAWKKALDLHPGWELAAVVDSDTEKLEHAPEVWGVPEDEAFTSMEEAIQFGAGSYDLAVIVTPIYTHHVLSIEALELGLNVICEKNLASTIDQGRQMVKAALDHPELCTGTGNQTRYFAKNWSLKKYYKEHIKQFGPINSVEFTGLYNWGKTRHGWRRWLPDLFLEDMAVHHLDYLRYVTDMDIVQVQGVNFKPSFSNFKGSSTTYAVLALAAPANYHYKDRWIYGLYRGDWQKKGEVYQECELNCTGGDLKLRDNDATAHVYEDEEGFKFQTVKVPITPDVEYNPQNYTDIAFMLDEMHQAIDSKGKKQPSTAWTDSFKSFAVTQGIKKSFETGQAVFVPSYWEDLGI